MATERAGSSALGQAAAAAPLGLFGTLDTTDEMAATTSDRAWVQALLDFESALALAEADSGLIPEAVAAQIAARCRAENFDSNQLGRGAPAGGNPVMPLLHALMDQLPPEAANFVHWGATSQDALDSAAMLVAKRAGVAVLADLDAAAGACSGLARGHRDTLQAGRTLLQQAVPTTFGLKAAGWLAAIDEVRSILAEVHANRLAIQLGGAAGTLAGLEGSGPQVAARLAARLQLADPGLPWHTDRVRPAQLAAALGMVAGVAAKVAQDVVLLSQTEVGEVRESGLVGRGGSSTMPQKRNPADSIAILAAYRRVVGLVSVILGGMAQELERSAGAWQAEWVTLTELLRLAGGISARLRSLLGGLQVDPERMAANLALTRGAVMAERLTLRLSAGMGRSRSRIAIEAALTRSLESGSSLRDELAADPEVLRRLGSTELEELFDPRGYLGAAQVFIGRALAGHPGHSEEDP